MNINKPMPILLLEDDKVECKLFQNHVEGRNDARFAGVTSSAIEALKLVQTHMPEGIIVDIELHNGEGSGLEFLTELNKLCLDFKPLVVVTTNISSDVIYNHAHENGADLIFYKKQNDYSQEMVINTLLLLRKTLYNNKSRNLKKIANIETLGEYENRVSNKINSELDLVGIGSHLKGRKYLYDAIYYLLQDDDLEIDKGSVLYYLANKYKIGVSAVGRAIQTAINYAWRISPIEDLEVHYTARINYETGVPTPMEFIYYYVEKIKKLL